MFFFVFCFKLNTSDSKGYFNTQYQQTAAMLCRAVPLLWFAKSVRQFIVVNIIIFLSMLPLLVCGSDIGSHRYMYTTEKFVMCTAFLSTSQC